MLIYIASDHAGFDVKNKVYSHLEELGHEVIDLGTDPRNPVTIQTLQNHYVKKYNQTPPQEGF